MSTDRPQGRDWQDLDAAEDPERLLAFLDDFAALSAVATYKARAFTLLEPRPGRRLLDAGCGTGLDVIALAERVLPGGEVVGVDLSARAIEAARKKTHGLAGVQFERADATALPFPDASFDGARMDRTLLHVPRPELAVSELVRVTRPGGHVVLTESTFTDPGSRRRRAPHKHEGQRVLAFLPFLLHRSGAERITVDRVDTILELDADMLELLGARAGPVEVSVVHVAGSVPG